jgi:hypothetical protein
MFQWLDIFQKGSKLFDSAAWKRGDITVSMLTGFLLALSQFAGDLYPPIKEYLTQDIITAAAVILLAVVNPIIHIVTSRSLGVEPK